MSSPPKTIETRRLLNEASKPAPTTMIRPKMFSFDAFMTPSKDHVDPKTKLVFGQVRRIGSPWSEKVTFLCPKMPNMNLIAQKVSVGYLPRRNGLIYNIYEDDSLVGSLVKTFAGAKSIQYVLSIGSNEVAVYQYKTHATSDWFQHHPPREASVAMLVGNSEDPSSDGQVFSNQCNLSFNRYGDFSGLAFEPEHCILQNTLPERRADGTWALSSSHGRARLPSRKFMQFHSDRSEILLQFTKWDRDVYNVDFQAPLAPYYVFGFALANLDL